MLTLEEKNFIYQRAYLSEQVPEYVESISGAEAHLLFDHLCFTKGNHLTFIGYPLVDAFSTQQAYEAACHQFQPVTVAIIAPQLWFSPPDYEDWYEDTYYRLALPIQHLHPEVAYMVRRAARELQVIEGEFGKEHQQLVKEFLSGHDEVTAEQRLIFERIPQYLTRSKTGRLLEARRENGVLIAFSVIDLGSADYAFHLFNFRSVKENVPGASDLLFHKMVSLAQDDGKKFLNMGLGINPGIRRFKQKWGGVPFLPYTSCLIRRQPAQVEALFDKL